MNKKELIDNTAQLTKKSKKQCEVCLDAIIKIISDALGKGENVSITNFGQFYISVYKPRKIRSVVDDKIIMTGEKYIPKFKASKNFKNTII